MKDVIRHVGGYRKLEFLPAEPKRNGSEDILFLHVFQYNGCHHHPPVPGAFGNQ